jgi:NAD+ synthase
MKKKEIIDHIAGWLNSYCEKSGMKGFAVGVSGGIDSALTSTLCALTQKPVVVLNMPILQNKKQFALAAKHIEWLKRKFSNVSGREVNLTEAFLKTQDSFPKEIQDAHSMANTRSRLRMVTLYAFATHYRYLVAGTGNKVEDFGVGFYTKYGDGGVDLSPIADLMKSEVYALAHELGVIPEILNATPVDGLWADNRTDEDQIGAAYSELEWAMRYLETNGKKNTAKVSKRQKEVLEIFQRFNKMNQHKMKPIPVCVIPEKFKEGK